MRVTYDMPADFKVGGPDLGYLAARHYLKTEAWLVLGSISSRTSSGRMAAQRLRAFGHLVGANAEAPPSAGREEASPRLEA